MMLFKMIVVYRNEGVETLRATVKGYDFTGGWLVIRTEDDRNVGIPSDLIGDVELVEISGEDELLGYREPNAFREGEQSPWMKGMGRRSQ